MLSNLLQTKKGLSLYSQGVVTKVFSFELKIPMKVNQQF